MRREKKKKSKDHHHSNMRTSDTFRWVLSCFLVIVRSREINDLLTDLFLFSSLSLSRCFSLAAELSLDVDLLELIIFEFISSSRLVVVDRAHKFPRSLHIQMIVLLMK